MTETLQQIIPQLANRKVLVVGDVILDHYITGEATRLSREAAIPVLEFQEERFIAGGAANPSANIVRLGSQAVQIAVIGNDANAIELQRELVEQGIDIQGLVIQPERPTTVKMRILAHMGLRFPQQVARVDRVSRLPIETNIEAMALENLQNQLPNTDAILFSDYHIGMLTPSLIENIRELARKNKVLLTADAQGSLKKYRQFDVVKCNAEDASHYLQRELKTNDDFDDASRELFKSLQLQKFMVITRGGDGATLATQNEVAYCPAPRVQAVYDTVGAGDTSIAVMTLAILAGATHPDAVRLANYASGIVIQHFGNYAPSAEELLKAISVNT